MTDIMSLGLTSVRAYTQGLATISDNVANAQTPGYARRSVRIEDATVIRYSDEWRNNEARIASGLASQASTRLEWLDAAERSLDDSATGVGQLVGAVFNRAKVQQGESVTFTITAQNPNSVAITNVVVVDALPRQITFTAATPPWRMSGWQASTVRSRSAG